MQLKNACNFMCLSTTQSDFINTKYAHATFYIYAHFWKIDVKFFLFYGKWYICNLHSLNRLCAKEEVVTC